MLSSSLCLRNEQNRDNGKGSVLVSKAGVCLQLHQSQTGEAGLSAQGLRSPGSRVEVRGRGSWAGVWAGQQDICPDGLQGESSPPGPPPLEDFGLIRGQPPHLL